LGNQTILVEFLTGSQLRTKPEIIVKRNLDFVKNKPIDWKVKSKLLEALSNRTAWESKTLPQQVFKKPSLRNTKELRDLKLDPRLRQPSQNLPHQAFKKPPLSLLRDSRDPNPDPKLKQQKHSLSQLRHSEPRRELDQPNESLSVPDSPKPDLLRYLELLERKNVRLEEKISALGASPP